MTSNFFIALGAVVPLFILIGIGAMVKFLRLLTETELNHINRMVFKVFFSIMMFYNLYTADFASAFRPKLIVFGSLGVIALFVLSMAAAYALEKEVPIRRGAMAQAIFRSNFVLLGIPIIGNIFGANELAIPTMMIAFIVPIYNVLAVIALETCRGGKLHLYPTIKNILKNPMILGAIFAGIARFIGISLPAPVLKPLGEVAAATTPVALIILGASFRLGSTREHRWELIFCTVSKLVLAPALMLGLAAWLGFRGVDFVTLIAIFATPCAVASFAMAQQMGSDAELAGNCVIFTSGLSCFTIFCWLLATKSLGLF